MTDPGNNAIIVENPEDGNETYIVDHDTGEAMIESGDYVEADITDW
jgi:hypothetical protein